MKKGKFKIGFMNSLIAMGVIGLSVVGVTACGTNDIEEEEETSYTFEATATGTWEVGETLTITATVDGEATTDFTVEATSGTNKVTIDGSTVTLTKEGAVVLTVTTTVESQTLTDTISGTITGEYASLQEVTVAQLLNELEAEATFSSSTYTATTLYKVTGVVESISNTSLGFFYLTDKETGDSIYVYGCSDMYSNITKNGTASYTYTNTIGAFQEVADEFGEGDEVTLVAMLGTLESAKTIAAEFYALVNKAEDMAIYKIDSTLPDFVTASKSENLTYGEEVTLTVDVDALNSQSLIVDSITHNGTEIEATGDAGDTYVFSTMVNNVIEVTTDDPYTQYFTASDLTSTSSNWAASLQEFQITLEKGLEISYYYLQYNAVSRSSSTYGWSISETTIRTRNYSNASSNAGTGEIWNRVATEYAIDSIIITPAKYMLAFESYFNHEYQITFSTDTMIDRETDKSNENFSIVTVQPNQNDVYDTTAEPNPSPITVECNLEGARYFNFMDISASTNASYFLSFQINFKIV